MPHLLYTHYRNFYISIILYQYFCSICQVNHHIFYLNLSCHRNATSPLHSLSKFLYIYNTLSAFLQYYISIFSVFVMYTITQNIMTHLLRLLHQNVRIFKNHFCAYFYHKNFDENSSSLKYILLSANIVLHLWSSQLLQLSRKISDLSMQFPQKIFRTCIAPIIV